MFKTILATAAAALIATAIAAPAQAGGEYWGKFPNGVSLNGKTGNGLEMNGKANNGRFSNGHIRNGKQPNGTAAAASSFSLDGIELPASVR